MGTENKDNELRDLLDRTKERESLMEELREAGREFFEEEDESLQRYLSDVIQKQKRYEVKL